LITINTQQLCTDFLSLGFQIELTQDGSPTLRLQQGESMHHSGGAAAETKYIYGNVLDRAHQILRESCKTCVVGLGLGYIEISWAISLLREKIEPSQDVTIHSFELVPGLIEKFKEWIETSAPHPVYDLVVEKLDPTSSIIEVKALLKKAFQTGSTFNGDLADFSQHQELYNVICYDAFSKKTNEGLWASEFLQNYFQSFAAKDCVVTTYACTGVLRKTLLEQNFAFFKRRGFCGKRDSSLATRGRFNLEDFPCSSFQTSSCNQ
jgi:hypothetical protein